MDASAICTWGADAAIHADKGASGSTAGIGGKGGTSIDDGTEDSRRKVGSMISIKEEDDAEDSTEAQSRLDVVASDEEDPEDKSITESMEASKCDAGNVAVAEEGTVDMEGIGI